jgi:hypothetical protein
MLPVETQVIESLSLTSLMLAETGMSEGVSSTLMLAETLVIE